MSTTLSKIDTRLSVKEDLTSFIKEVVGVNDQDFINRVYDIIYSGIFDGYDVTNGKNKGIKDFHADYINELPEEEHENFIPRLKILHPKHYPAIKGFVKRLEEIMKYELK